MILNRTVFGMTDLSQIKSLESCKHLGPSIIDHATLSKSGDLPISFLRGVGLPDNYIDYLPSFRDQAIQYYSCFISYCSKDEEFAKRIHSELQSHGVRCWFAPEDMKIGNKIRQKIDDVIRIFEKLLLILSEKSILSDWVEKEVETCFEK